MPEVELVLGVRRSSESDKAVVACNDWLRLGAGRTMPRLLERYRDLPQNTAPTTSLDTLQAWSKKNGWAERATEFDAGWEARKNTEREAELAYGLALDYERIRKLKRLADFLESQLYEQSAPDPLTGIRTFLNVWIPDIKTIGSGDNAERVDIERFNPAIFEQYRAVLDDLAKEVGGRIRKQDITSGGKPIDPIRLVEVIRPPDDEETLPD